VTSICPEKLDSSLEQGIKTLKTKFLGEGHNLVCFLARILIRVDTYKWESILTFNGKFFLFYYGEIPYNYVLMARIEREQAIVISLVKKYPKLNAFTLFYFVFDSLGPLQQQKSQHKIGNY
jgi:hypothetical protein